MNRFLSLISFSILLFVIIGCSSQTPEKDNTSLTIYTSLYPIQYIVKQIAGDSATVESVYPPGVDAHTYEPTSKKVTAIAESDAFIYLGAGMEGFAESLEESVSTHDVAFVELGEYENLFHKEHTSNQAPVEHAEHDYGDHDPHIWLDPLRMIEMAAIIKDELTQLNPDNEEKYIANVESLKDDLTLLDKEFKETLQPKEEKYIIVSHAAYGYWEERYGIEQIAINGLTSGNEPSQKELTKIVELAKKKNLKYVIFEQNGTDRVSKIIQKHINADALHIHNLEILTDEDIENGKDYLSLMRSNLEVLDKATN